jgi:serine/threonine-protein kinase
MKSQNKDNSIKKLAVLALASVLVAVIAAVGSGYYLFGDLFGEREVIEIPDFVGQRSDAIGEFDNLTIEREAVFSDNVREGRVISQFPYGGAKRKIADGEKYTVKLTVSLGKELKTVPELKNYKYTDAAAALRSLGAKIKIVSVYDDGIEKDTVLRTSPKAGEGIEAGDTVTLFVVRNHIHAPVCVKDFVGMPLDRATTELLAEGLTLGEITGEYSDSAAKGEVISQRLKQGSLVPYGSRVDIVVSKGKGPETLHPFRGQNKEENGETDGID